MDNEKYTSFFDVSNILFPQKKMEINMSKCVCCVVNNSIKRYSDKVPIIDFLFKMFKKQLCVVYVITVYPTPRKDKISSIKELLNFLCNMNFVYNTDIEIQNDFISSLVTEIVCWETYVKNSAQSVLVTFDKHTTIVINKDIKQMFTHVVPAHLSDTLISALYDEDFDIRKVIVSKKNDNREIINSKSVCDLIFVLYGIFLFTYNKENEMNTILLAIDIFDNFSKTFENIDTGKLVILVNFFSEWIYFNKLKCSSTSESIYLKHMDNLSITHISYKKFSRMISKLSITNIAELENKINHLCENFKVMSKNIISDNSFYYSKYSLGGWKEEIEEKSCLGVIMTIAPADYNRTGKWVDDVIFTSLTNIFVSAVDYVNILNSKNEFNGNPLSVNMENLLLPVYINKIHWNMSKCYIPMVLGMSLANNASMYTDKMKNLYFVVLVEYFFHMVSVTDCNERKMYFKLWISLLRTCAEISKENGYHKGFSKYCDNIISAKKNKTFPVNTIFGQIMSVGKTVSHTDLSPIVQKINAHIEKSSDHEKRKFKTIYSAIQLIFELKNRHCGFKNLLKIIDDSGGILPKVSEDFALEYISKNIVTQQK